MGTGIFATPNPTLGRLPIGPTPVCFAFKTWERFSDIHVIRPGKAGDCDEEVLSLPRREQQVHRPVRGKGARSLQCRGSVILAWANPFAGENDSKPG